MSKLSVIYQLSGITKRFKTNALDGIESLNVSKEIQVSGAATDSVNHLTMEEFEHLLTEGGLKSIGDYKDRAKNYKEAKKDLDYIIINTLEKDPASNINRALLNKFFKEIGEGFTTLSKLYKVKKFIFIVDKTSKESVEKLTSGLSNKEIKVVPYSYGWLGEEYIKEKLALSQGKFIMEDILNIYYLYQLFNYKQINNYVIGVEGHCLNKKGYFLVESGTTYKELIDLLGGFKEEPYKIVLGGVLKGQGIYNLKESVKPGDYSLLFLGEKEGKTSMEYNCIRCGQCLDICPKNLIPSKLNEFALTRSYERFKKAQGMECIDCGLCSYTCPSKRHLTQSISTAKKLLLKEAN
ncbi:4Fe-4S dicluster domain-containing protein [Desnuesiella massiliensis]|uniref:4Fe-4S dicluster domain-containing protein n=1 Tax=Desnuesiella massiliensis TaxID=1650662 RepID=UPI0006E2B5C3|nr:4Fe-4S dicluster domain-containing protein [Desnuesiella massiliensis]